MCGLLESRGAQDEQATAAGSPEGAPPLLAGSLRGVPSIPLYSPLFLVGRGGQGVMVVESEYLQSASYFGWLIR